MKKNQIKLGGTYLAKVTDKVVPVRLDAANPRGGWDATNLATNKKVRIKSAQRLRGPAPSREARAGAKATPVAKDAAPKEKAAGPAYRLVNATGAVVSEHLTENAAENAKARLGERGAKVVAVGAPEAEGAGAADSKIAKAVAAAQTADAAANAGAVPPVKATKGKAPKAPKAPKVEKPKKLSGLDAAAQVLKGANQPMGCKDVVETMLAKGMWKTGGKTPAATIYAAILREIQTKGNEARFTKTDRGLFTFNA